MFKGFAVFCSAVTVLVSVVNASIYCKNDDNKDVDWFFMYKLPRGSDYLYVDSNTPSSERYWRMSSKKISSQNGALGYTIARLTAAKKPKDLTYAVYNDQVEKKQDQEDEHTKGLFMFDKETGVWLIHSVPNFPVLGGSKDAFYPSSKKEKGQVVLCVTFPTTQLETIAKHLLLQHPNIYASASALDWKKHPHLTLLLDKKFRKEAPFELIDTLQDVAKKDYISFATHASNNKDVYSDLVARRLQSNLLVSTWRIGRGEKLPPIHGGGYLVANVQKLTFKIHGDISIDVNNTADHSKWAISNDSANRYVCVGTLNRKEPQTRKGGETLCFKNELLHKLLSASITCHDGRPCKRQRA